MSGTPTDATASTKREEIRAFAFLAFVLIPVLSVIFVAGYGFMVWIWQIFAGPPGPPPP
ncbi:MAG TPA: periplasmic nitrate reductase, NapE protein [Steroidobacteraceae bacterium]|jgi:nitrate reductase NapE|nr:periplasmic nitrate reductase, NapE protein [Steroidobacteraceae bacterium]